MLRVKSLESGCDVDAGGLGQLYKIDRRLHHKRIELVIKIQLQLGGVKSEPFCRQRLRAVNRIA